MQVSHDNLFLIGHSHKVCQDYTLSGQYGDIHYAIVCDGCSSSRDTDIGARILAMAARQYLEFAHLGYEAYGSMVIRRANDIRVSFGLDISCLDATLMVAFTNGGIVESYCYGDGYIIDSQSNTGMILLHEHKFESGAPYYLSYWIDKGRAAGYKEKFGDGQLVITTWLEDEVVASQKFSYDNPIECESEIRLGALILSSDGLDSFSVIGGAHFNANQLHKPFIAFKGTVGEFLKRRVVKQCETLQKQLSLYHQDDLGMACLLFKEEV